MTSQLTDPVNDRMPTDEAMLTALIDSQRRMIGFLREADESTGDTPVAATPAWSVRNLAAHVLSVGTMITTGGDWGDDPQIVVDREVAARADHTLAQLADEWEEMLATLENIPLGPGASVLLVDAITHEYDMRSALGPEYHSRTIGVPEGLSALVAWVRHQNLVEQKIEFRTPTSVAAFGDGPAVTTVDVAGDWELMRILGVRRSVAQLEALPREGDIDPLIAITSRYPHPVNPLETDYPAA